MIHRLYVHNFGCLANFDLELGDQSSILLLGKNGSGKSTIRRAFAVLQAIARGTNRVGSLVRPQDCFRGRTDEPVRIELDARVHGLEFQYRLAFELPPGFKQMRVQREQLIVDGRSYYSREGSVVTMAKERDGAGFVMDWHMVALPIIQEASDTDPLFLFKSWLARSVILAPIPALISGESSDESLQPEHDGSNLAAWFAGLIAYSPAAYATMDTFLKRVMHDLWDIKNPLLGKETRSLTVQFRHQSEAPLQVPLAALSDGEKCFFLCALLLAANEAYGPLFCFWDEPDSHLSLDEVSHFVVALRRAFGSSGGQLLMASHNAETIRRFSDENTLILYRRSHLEPTRFKPLEDCEIHGDLINALIAGDIDP